MEKVTRSPGHQVTSLVMSIALVVIAAAGFVYAEGSQYESRGKRDPFFITDSRYIEAARESVAGYYIRLVKESLYRNIEEIISRLPRMRLQRQSRPSKTCSFTCSQEKRPRERH